MEEQSFRYEDMPDEQVVERSAAGEKGATEYILDKYKNMVRAKAKMYYLAGADKEDLIQEGMIGLFKAIRDFDATYQASFHGFAEMCIKRQMITAVKTAARLKHGPLNSYVSLNTPVYEDESERTLVDILAEREAIDPEELILRQEKEEALEAEIAQKLSGMEQTVLSLYLGGKNYQEIAKEMGRTPKSIDNALQRIKRKLTAEE